MNNSEIGPIFLSLNSKTPNTLNFVKHVHETIPFIPIEEGWSCRYSDQTSHIYKRKTLHEQQNKISEFGLQRKIKHQTQIIFFLFVIFPPAECSRGAQYSIFMNIELLSLSPLY